MDNYLEEEGRGGVIYFKEYFDSCLDRRGKCQLIWSAIRPIYGSGTQLLRSARWRSWLKHCAASRKVKGSIPVDLVRIFR